MSWKLQLKTFFNPKAWSHSLCVVEGQTRTSKMERWTRWLTACSCPGHGTDTHFLVSETPHYVVIPQVAELSLVLRSLSWSASKRYEYINLSGRAWEKMPPGIHDAELADMALGFLYYHKPESWGYESGRARSQGEQAQKTCVSDYLSVHVCLTRFTKSRTMYSCGPYFCFICAFPSPHLSGYSTIDGLHFT